MVSIEGLYEVSPLLWERQPLIMPLLLNSLLLTEHLPFQECRIVESAKRKRGRRGRRKSSGSSCKRRRRGRKRGRGRRRRRRRRRRKRGRRKREDEDEEEKGQIHCNCKYYPFIYLSVRLSVCLYVSQLVITF